MIKDYKSKYLKYKSKYLKLQKDQKGGLRRCDLVISDINMVNMIKEPSVAMVHAHGCIIGQRFVHNILEKQNETFWKSTFTLPNNVNIITCTTLNKKVDHITTTSKFFRCPITSVSEIRNFIEKGSKFFENNNMSDILTNDCIEFFEKYFIKYNLADENCIIDIRNPNAPLHLRNHIFPSEINESLITKFEDYHGISIVSDNRITKSDIKTFNTYTSKLNEQKNFKELRLSELICYLFGVSSLSQTRDLPHLTIILHACRTYCSKDDKDTDIYEDDHVFSKTSDLNNESFLTHNNNYEIGEFVLITGTIYKNFNTLVGEIISKKKKDKVIIKDLIKDTDLNGMLGFIDLKKEKKLDRWAVTISGNPIEKSILEKNLIFFYEYEINCLQNNIFNIKKDQIIKLKDLDDEYNKYNNQKARIIDIKKDSIEVLIESSIKKTLSINSSNIEMLPVIIDNFSNKNLRKILRENISSELLYDKNYLYLTDSPDNFKRASLGKVININEYNPDQITIKDDYTEIINKISINDIFVVL